MQLQTRIIRFKRINPTLEISFHPINTENYKGIFKLSEGQLLSELALYNIYVKKDIQNGSIFALQALQYIERSDIQNINTLLWCALIYVSHEMKDQALAEIYSQKLAFAYLSGERDSIVHKIEITSQQESEYYESVIKDLRDGIYVLEEKEKVKNEELNFLMMQLMKRDEYISLIQKKHSLISKANQKHLSAFCKETLIQYRNLPKIHLRTSLIRKHPILTSLETDICILLSIGLSSKEIGILMDKVPATIDNMRSIIQRKLSNKLYNKSLKEYLNDIEKHYIIETGNELHISDILSKAGISMSIRQMKVISLLCIHMGSKEICDIMGISVRTLENHKYRIKKKLGLDKNKDLIQFLLYKLEPECN
jgi:DNA-binding CsgD family transcriptional regulator